MTEAEWLACDDPQPLARYLFGCISPRKLRLWACACGREVLPCFANPLMGKVLDLFEGVAEGERSREAQQRPLSELQWAAEDEQSVGFSRAVAGIAHSQWIEMVNGYEGHFALGLLHLASAKAYNVCPMAQAEGPTDLPADPTWLFTYSTAQKKQSALARDIVGNPFRSAAINRSWLTSDVVSLARGIYVARAFDRLPILADALQDAGCEHEDVLSHCRGSDPHVRGCWVLDAVLGKG
jgi:hypothetical protein